MTRNRCPVRARRRARLNPQSRRDAPSLKSEEPRRASRRSVWRRQWRWQFRWRVGCQCHGHALRRQYRADCHLRWQDHGGMEYRSSQPKRRLDGTRIRRGSELDQFRAHVGPQRLRFIRAIRRMYRALDRVQTVILPNGDFRGCSRPHLWRRASPNYTPSAPKLRLIATQVSDHIGCTKRCVSVPGL